jgi:Bacterial Ig-like domain (group 1).
VQAKLTTDGVTVIPGQQIDFTPTRHRARGRSRAEVAGGGGGAETTFNAINTPDVATSVVLALAPDTILGDGASKSTATATVQDQYANPVPNDTVVFSSDDLAQTVGATTKHGDGTYSAQVKSIPTQLGGSNTITATDTSPPSPVLGTALLTETPDNVAPGVKIKAGPSGKVKGKTVHFRFASSAADVDGFECRLDGSTWKPCVSPMTYKVSLDKHTFRVRATDLAATSGLSTAAASSASSSRPAARSFLGVGRALDRDVDRAGLRRR